MKFDEFLKTFVGDFGLYQKVQFLLVCFPFIFTGMHTIVWTFTAANIPFRCLTHGENETNFPFKLDNYKSYSLHFYNFGNATDDPYENITLNGTDTCAESCHNGYKWDTSQIKNSAVKEWEIVCERSWLKSFIQSLYFAGQVIGSICFGGLADKYGRKLVLCISLCFQTICAIAMAFVPYLVLFVFFRIGVGLALPAINCQASILAMELVGPARHDLASSGCCIFFFFGSVVLGSLAYGIRDYSNLQLAISIPSLIFVLYWWIVPESARWLISQGRYDEAGKVLRVMARLNGGTLAEDWQEQLDVERNPVSNKNQRGFFQNVLSLFKTANMRKRTLVLFVCWPSNIMAYYGLAMNPSFYEGDLYLTFVIGGLLDVVGVLIVLFTMNLLGRKILLLGGFLLTTLCLLLTLVVPDGYGTIKMVLVCSGKMALTGGFVVIYAVTLELFPTVIRATAAGTCNMIARLGAIAASYISLWLADISPIAAILIFASTCLISGVLTIILPETTNHRQLETIEEAESFGNDQPLFVFVWRKKHNLDVKQSEQVCNASHNERSVA